MDGYELHFDEATQGASQLEKIIEDLRSQIDDMNKTEEELLNDQLWYGPNKSRFSQRFAEYKQAVEGLYTSAVDHHSKLVEILNTYQAAEA